jgi:hypothetical protein
MEEVLSQLGDADARVRAAAAEALGLIGDPQAMEGLLAHLEDPDAQVREAATVALGEMGDQRAVAGLLTFLDGLGYRLLGGYRRNRCDWAYETITAILAETALEPESEPVHPAPPVPGPWDEVE